MRTVGVIGGVGDCEGASKGISKVIKAPVKELEQNVQVKPQKQNTKSWKSDLEGGLPTIELPEWWDLLSLSLRVML